SRPRTPRIERRRRRSSASSSTRVSRWRVGDRIIRCSGGPGKGDGGGGVEGGGGGGGGVCRTRNQRCMTQPPDDGVNPRPPSPFPHPPRIGIGYDSHRFAPPGPLILGGVPIPSELHLEGHSDGDAAAHALTDAILGAAAAGDIGEMFSDS